MSKYIFSSLIIKSSLIFSFVILGLCSRDISCMSDDQDLERAIAASLKLENEKKAREAKEQSDYEKAIGRSKATYEEAERIKRVKEQQELEKAIRLSEAAYQEEKIREEAKIREQKRKNEEEKKRKTGSSGTGSGAMTSGASLPVGSERLQKSGDNLIVALVDNFIKDARLNDMIIKEKSMKVNGSENILYQIRVNDQSDNSCATRAIFNCLRLVYYFSKAINLNNLIDSFLKSDKIEMFMKNSKSYLETHIKYCQERNSKIVKGIKVQVPVFKFNGDHPVDLDSYGLEVIKKAEGGNPKINLIDDVFNLDMIRILYSTDLKKEKEGFFDSFVCNTASEYNASRGLEGTSSIAKRSYGHWIGFVVVKTEKKQYKWFVMDSLNSEDRLEAGIVAEFIKNIFVK